MAGKLYLVGTPIGNLGDMSPRARRTLEEADFIAAEDTRVTLKLLNHFNIKSRSSAITSTTPSAPECVFSNASSPARPAHL